MNRSRSFRRDFAAYGLALARGEVAPDLTWRYNRHYIGAVLDTRQEFNVSTHTIEISGISDDLLDKLDKRAKGHGRKREEFARYLLERGLDQDQQQNQSLLEILKPIHDETERMGLSDEDIGEFVDEQIRLHRAEKRARQAAERCADEK
jgi:hypothetical protein